MASVAVRALLTQETTDTASEVVALQLKQQLRELQSRYQKTLEDLRRSEDHQIAHPSVVDLERKVARLTEERDYYRTSYINTLEAKTALLNGEIPPSDLK